MADLHLLEETRYLKDLLTIELDYPRCVHPSCYGWGLTCRDPEIAVLFERHVEESEQVYDATESYDPGDLPRDAPQPSVPTHYYTLTPKNGLLLCLENLADFSSWVLLQEKSYIFFRLLKPNLYHATVEWDEGGWRVGQLIEAIRARQEDENRPSRYQGALSMGLYFIPTYQDGLIAWDSSQIHTWRESSHGTAIAIRRESPPFVEGAKKEVVALVAQPALAHLFISAPGLLESGQMVVEVALAAGLSSLPFSIRPALAFLRQHVEKTMRLLQEKGGTDIEEE